HAALPISGLGTPGVIIRLSRLRERMMLGYSLVSWGACSSYLLNLVRNHIRQLTPEAHRAPPRCDRSALSDPQRGGDALECSVRRRSFAGGQHCSFACLAIFSDLATTITDPD